MMTDTDLMEAEGLEEPIEEEEETEDEDELFYEIYVETASNLIHEVQFFPEFVLVRPASPNLYLTIRKVSLLDFSKEFHEYLGDPQAVRDFLKNTQAEFLVE